jgi:NADH-quinone oxidoreductase subunit J
MNTSGFWIVVCIGLALIVGVYAINSARLIRLAYAIFILFCVVAAFFLGLGAGYAAASQLFIYVGAILLTLMMGLMLTQSSIHGPSYTGWRLGISGVVICVVSIGLCYFFSNSTALSTKLTAKSPAINSSVQALGQQLFIGYGVLVEWLSLLLLIALIGAVYLSRHSILNR